MRRVVGGGQDVERDGQDLETEEDDDEVVGRPHDHGPRCRQHGQDVELGADHPFPAQVAVGDQGGEQHGDGHHDLDEDVEPVEGDGAGDGHLGAVRGHVVPLEEGGHQGGDRRDRRP